MVWVCSFVLNWGNQRECKKQGKDNCQGKFTKKDNTKEQFYISILFLALLRNSYFNCEFIIYFQIPRANTTILNWEIGPLKIHVQSGKATLTDYDMILRSYGWFC